MSVKVLGGGWGGAEGVGMRVEGLRMRFEGLELRVKFIWMMGEGLG